MHCLTHKDCPAYVFTEEETLNISLYCYVTSDNIQIQNQMPN